MDETLQTLPPQQELQLPPAPPEALAALGRVATVPPGAEGVSPTPETPPDPRQEIVGAFAQAAEANKLVFSRRSSQPEEELPQVARFREIVGGLSDAGVQQVTREWEGREASARQLPGGQSFAKHAERVDSILDFAAKIQGNEARAASAVKPTEQAA